MANRIQITIPSVQVLALSADPFEAVRIYDEGKKQYTDQQATNDAGVPLWRARNQVVSFTGVGVQGNVEVASRQEPHVAALKTFDLKDATLSVWSDRRSGELGVKVTAEVGE